MQSDLRLPSNDLALTLELQNIPKLELLRTVSSEMQQLSQLVLDRLEAFRSSLNSLQGAESQLAETSQRTFARLNAALQIKIASRLDQQKTQEKVTHLRCLSPKRLAALQIKPAGTRLRTCPKRLENQAKVVEEQISQMVPPQLLSNFISKTQKVGFEVYMCFICIRGELEDCMWEDEDQYVDHMGQTHQIDLSFETIIRSKAHKMLCSHLMFKGSLVNLLTGIYRMQSQRIYYCIEKQKYDRLFYCGCNHIKKNNYPNYGIFDSEFNFVNHLRDKVCPKEEASHFLKKVSRAWQLEKNPQFQYSSIKKKYASLIEWHERSCLHIVRNVITRRLLQQNPRNILQLISCYPDLISNKQMKLSLLYCRECDLFFNSINGTKVHFHIKHPNVVKNQLKVFQISRNDVIAQGEFIMNQTRKQYFHAFNKLKQLANNEIELSEDQFYGYYGELCIIFSSAHDNVYFICGDCKKCFLRDMFGYILHIYTEHQHLHPLNSHFFTFLKDSCQDAGVIPDKLEELQQF